MTYRMKLCGVLATGAFVITSLISFIQSQQPLKVFLVSCPAAMVCGLLGYAMGNILDHPRYRKPRTHERVKKTPQPKLEEPSPELV